MRKEEGTQKYSDLFTQGCPFPISVKIGKKYQGILLRHKSFQVRVKAADRFDQQS